ncbi:MAG: ATP synthase F1 subunit delta [Bacteroidales bacterium]|jgi:F-type H+-transporting ATPase subunit delta|nr:ATP synthase F1 subunit delta [Bacteroidales bacterium]
MNNSQIPKRYARALFELADEMNVLPATELDMRSLKKVCDEAPEFKQFLKSPIIKPALKKKVISSLFEQHFHELSIRFLKLVIHQGRETFMNEIAKEFMILCREKEGVVEVDLTAATKLNDSIVKQIEAKIASLTGLKPSITQKTNPSLLGGFVVSFGDNMYDASLKKKISKISRDFRTNIYEKGF